MGRNVKAQKKPASSGQRKRAVIKDNTKISKKSRIAKYQLVTKWQEPFNVLCLEGKVQP